MEKETGIWFSIWQNKNLSDEAPEKLDMTDVFNEADQFFCAVIISRSQQCETASIERSFGTLRRIKTWLRSFMGGNRLSGN